MNQPSKLPPGVLVDDEDLERVLQFRWHINHLGYVVSDQRKWVQGRRSGKVILLHRFLLDFPDSQIDHKNRNRLDNRRNNLRLASKAQNMMNRAAPKHSKSGYKCISWCSRLNRWRVQITFEGTKHELGYFKEIPDALKAYNDNIERIQGEWAVKQ